jgi:aldehyde dehydrogenase (NAD+)
MSIASVLCVNVFFLPMPTHFKSKNQTLQKVIPALLVGCTAVLKPSEESPLSALLFAEMMDKAGFPPGVFNLVSGDGPTTGDALTRNPNVDMISFTGSARAGRQIAANAAMNLKKTSMELGGKGANILFADVGDEWMAKAVVQGTQRVFFNSGQTCNAPTRMFVQRPYYEKAIQLAKFVADSTKVNSAHVDGGSHIGPVVNQKQYDRIQQLLQTGIDEGATLIAGGLGRPDNLDDQGGFYVKPTVFADCTNNMTIMQEEIFGPVLCITPFDSEDEVLEMANDTPYGLTNYVQSRSLERRKRMGRKLRSGMVDMNDAYGNAGSPFGGMKGSGYGKEGGVYGLEEFCVIKAITGYNVSPEDLTEVMDEL